MDGTKRYIRHVQTGPRMRAHKTIVGMPAAFTLLYASQCVRLARNFTPTCTHVFTANFGIGETAAAFIAGMNSRCLRFWYTIFYLRTMDEVRDTAK